MRDDFLLGALLLLSVAQPVLAQERVDIAGNIDWLHIQSKATLPATLAGFARTEVIRYDEEGYNIGATYGDRRAGTWATVYLFRAGVADLSIWADRAAAALLNQPAIRASEVRSDSVGLHQEPGRGTGFKLLAPMDGYPTASTGLAIFNHDDWLIKVRFTSHRLDVEALDAKMTELIKALTLPQSATAQKPLVPIQNCSAPLKIGKGAKLAKFDMMGSMMFGAVIRIAAEKSATEAKDQPLWCRDRTTRDYSTYRNDVSENSYTMAVGDAGVTVSVSPYSAKGLMQPSRGYMVLLSDGVTERVYPPFTKMPGPDQVLAVLRQVAPVTTTDIRPGGTGGTTIHITGE